MSGQESHESFIKTPRQLVLVVVLTFVVVVLAFVMLAYLVVTGSKKPDLEQSSQQAEALAKRIRPVAEVVIAEAAGSAPRAARSGEQVVQQYCAACHTSGAAGAPRIGDSGAWAKRIGSGLGAMLKLTIAGKNAMPPRGGAADASDYELERAIVFMANRSGGRMQEPVAPKSAGEPERTGEQIVRSACAKCHETGERGAPKIGDKAAWARPVSEGIDAVTKSAIHGHGNMPARGGLADLTDAEVSRAILYMFSRAGAGPAAGKGAAAPSARK